MLCVVLAGFVLALLAAPVQAQWTVKTEDGKSFVKTGFLLQGRGEWVKVQDSDPVAQNLYLRRARILIGGQVNPNVSFFFETDSPNAGKVAEGGQPKSYGDVFVQDFVATYTVTDRFMVDGGLILVPTSYNHLQSAASLVTVDYGPFTFIENGPMQERVGRDTGLQARGVLGEKLVEYRLGVFQGVRGAGDVNSLRGTARVSVHPLKTAGKGLFYTGTAFGKAKVMSLGAAVDMQKDYSSVHGDAYLEWPLSPESTVNLQIDVSSYDGGDLLPGLPKQVTAMIEAGGTLMQNRVAGWVQLSARDYDDEEKGDVTVVHAGVGYYQEGHRAAVKLGATMASTDTPKDGVEVKDVMTVTLQYQVFYF
jgi:hypothetical protein